MKKDISKYKINKDLTLLDALIQIEGNHHRSLIVLDNNNKVTGSLSDGDIRRALINGILLSSNIHKIMNTDYVFIEEDSTDAKIKKTFDMFDVFLLPCVDEGCRLVKLYTKSEF
jgi:mannose-1-phosphate guanylyltransferase / mannose-6-phosphate isomerase